MNATMKQLQILTGIIDHTVETLREPGKIVAPLTQDFGLSFRDRTKNFLPFTSVAALIRAYRNNRISKGLFELLEGEMAVAEYRQIRVSQIVTHYNREVKTLPVLDAKIMTMGLAEILSRTLFFHLTTRADQLDDISLSIYEWLIDVPGYSQDN